LGTNKQRLIQQYALNIFPIAHGLLTNIAHHAVGTVGGVLLHVLDCVRVQID